MEGREVEPTPDAVIGREGTDIVLADPEVSRRHAAIRAHGDGVAIEDLGSTNGTYVNDQRVQGTQPLSDGDTVRLGNTVWRVRATAAAAGATMVGQVPAAPQVTSARAVPTDLQPPTPQPPAQPAAPAAPSPQAVGRRGDVPAPPEVAPSAIRRVLPPPGAGQAPAFSPPGSRQITSKTGSAATRVEATIVCLAIVLIVAVVVTVYFASQG
jgi:predicted component of type VI protein secretion system